MLLSVGEAMLDQSRDVSLVGGGEVTVLPQGIDVEAMRTGGVSGMFFGIDRARFVTRQLLGGHRQRSRVRAVSPVIEDKLLYLRHGGEVIAARAGGEIPSRAAAVDAGLQIKEGAWSDSPRTRLGSRRAPSSSTTSWIGSTCRRPPIPAGGSGTTSILRPGPTSGGTSPTWSVVRCPTAAGVAGC